VLRKLIIFGLIAVGIGLAAYAIVTRPEVVEAGALGPHQTNLGNGKEMFAAGNCASCHASPNQEDTTQLGGGHAMKTPFGTFYTPNISPDEKDGIGNWSEAQFVTALIEGTSPDRMHYYPAFPYPSFQRMNVNDARDLFAYIKTLPKVAGKSPAHELGFPFNIRAGLGGWKLLFLDGKPFQPDPAQSAQWNRGAYLVNGPAHCVECHSPRNALGAIVENQRFTGGPDPDGDGWLPNITQKGLGNWSEKDIAEMLKSGDLPDGDRVGGDMVKVVRNTAQLSDADRAAIAAYIKSLPPVDGPQRPPRD
jgi:mono/diheme cytochrome c family protein